MTNRFDLGSLGLGSLNSMLESVDFVKQAWSSFNLPASLAPTMDLDELDKRIADLKTVEQWLNINLNMLRGTIQAMEVQRGTLAALKTFGDQLAPNAQGLGAMAAAAAQAAIRATQPPTSAAEQPADAASADRVAAQRAGTDRPALDASAGQGAGENPAAGQPADESIAAGLSRAAAAAINPSTWWTMLQHQFNQIAQAAAAGVQDTAGEAAKAQSGSGGKPVGRAKGKATKGRPIANRPKAATEPATARPSRRASPAPAQGEGASAPAASRSRSRTG